jgi:YbbR domain-containing protein
MGKLQMKKYDKKNITKTIKKSFLENLNIKIICFFLAIAVYIAVGFFQLNEKTFICRLNVVGLKDDLMIANDVPSTVKIIVRDKQKTLNNLTENDFNVRLDLSGKDISTTDIRIKRNLPPSIESVFSSIKVVPDKVSVTIDRLEEKTVPIDLNYSGDPEEGFAITNISIDPAEVRIQGSKKALEKIKYIETEKINIAGLNEMLKKEANLLAPDSVKIVGKSKTEVTIAVERNQ